MMSRSKILSVCFVVLCVIPPVIFAQENAQPPKVAAFLTDTTIGFARARIDRLNLEPVRQLIRNYATGLGGDSEQIEMFLLRVQNLQKQLVEAGATDVYVVADLENFLFGPYLLLDYSEGADVAALTELLQAVLQKIPVPAGKQFQALDEFIFAGDEEILRHIKSGHIARRPQLAAALASVDTDLLQVVICPSPDQTRAIREAVPKFPAPFAQLDGAILARGLQYLSMGFHLEPDLGIRAVIQSADAQSAEVLLAAEQQVVAMSSKLVAPEFPMAAIEKLAGKLNLQRENDRLLLDFSFQPEEWDQLAALLKKPTEGIVEQSGRNQSINNLRQLGLAMHNWHDVYKVLPAHANYDKNGKPLLSWRVHVLPYLDQSELYAKFKLNEPWDSEHNKQFISQMPEVFAVPGSEVSRTGRTGYVVPILKDGSAITTGNKDGIQLREITDGTSNTALIVVADDEHAVIWTKPDDLQIDPEKPLLGLRFSRDEMFAVLAADGSVHQLPKSIDPAMWLKLLTRAGGEVVQW